jgi:hypothetical protein
LIQKEKESLSQNPQQIQIQDLLDAAQNVDMDYLGEKTLETISEEVVQSLSVLDISDEKRRSICEKLVSYRYVDQIYQLHKGKYIRWIRIQSSDRSMAKPSELVIGGVVVNISFTDNGTFVLCNCRMRFFKFKFDDCLIYQRLSDDEQMILSCQSYIQQSASSSRNTK